MLNSYGADLKGNNLSGPLTDFEKKKKNLALKYMDISKNISGPIPLNLSMKLQKSYGY